MTETQTAASLLPATFEEARDQLSTLGTMTTSAEWERAAIVYALTKPSQGQRTSPKIGQGKISFSDLAKWNVVGLTSRNQVSAYWHFWDDAVDEGLAETVSLGDTYTPPDKEWPGFPKHSDPNENTTSLTPFDQACDLFNAATKKITEITTVKDLDAADKAELLGEPMEGYEAAFKRLKKFLNS